MRMAPNKQTWESEETVTLYRLQEGLQKPEKTILRLLQSVIAGGRVLDIGVGAGRTTPYFSQAAREYIGIDYSPGMIAACREKFRGASQSLSFIVCDVRDMHCFGDHSFDFVMFSYNGLDYLPPEDRQAALGEIKRVCRPGGYFAFSTHNMHSAPRLFRLLPKCDSWQWPYMIYVNHRRRALNPHFRQLLKRKFAIFNDGALNFRLWTYYVEPRHQIEQLHAVGFTDVRVFSLSDGSEIKTMELLDENRDSWLYFCMPQVARGFH